MLSKGKYNLVCVAHPDDETLFFGGLLLSERRRPWVAICMTSDGSAVRKKQFFTAARKLGITETQWWEYPDVYDQRLPIEAIVPRLGELPTPYQVFTHGIVGEYGHPHHQDVSLAVHRAFSSHPRLFVASYNTYPELQIRLTRSQFEKKAEILTKVYGSETQRFLNVLPVTFNEGFSRLSLGEVEALYDYFAKKKPLRPRDIKENRAVLGYLPHLRGLKRPF